MKGALHGMSRTRPTVFSGSYRIFLCLKHGLFAHCHACAFGGNRQKKTFLSKQNIIMMQLFCQDVAQHEHEPWGYNPVESFATALEAQYPAGMCDQLVGFLDEMCMESGFIVQPADQTPPRTAKHLKGRSTSQLIAEYAKVVSILLRNLPSFDSKRCLCQAYKQIPGSRLLRTENKGDKVLCVFGIYHSCEEFVKLSRQLWHPFDMAAQMSSPARSSAH